MPVLSTASVACSQIYDPTIRGIRGIPLQYYVKPVVRQGGVFVDYPKGFELPTCTVDPCCPDPAPAP